MNCQLPDAVTAYFDISNGGGDTSLMATCFSANATVFDENRTHKGIEAIESWQREARQAFTYQIKPIEVTERAGTLTVAARVTGNFPGSPVKLNHAFTVLDGRIHTLEITP
ncbi:nuclear transport factor 2 family protein [Pseudomonas sp. FP2196]|uniref:nuclear transport factor 2 family protein n=1 Tax=Pseudomonas sp. FP2196 TaxID=2954086 RepID=UPI0027357DBF|nr:nuclear transport factor 2 family protein [Pseudomonas sp. FP2196]WLH38329.1 nuclear transport factor 2 family protein [Pseudomonas sp. FP2196]